MIFTFFSQISQLTEDCKVFLLQFLMDKYLCLKSYYTLVFPKIINSCQNLSDFTISRNNLDRWSPCNWLDWRNTWCCSSYGNYGRFYCCLLRSYHLLSCLLFSADFLLDFIPKDSRLPGVSTPPSSVKVTISANSVNLK